jgi:uncharacterized membrane protein YoaK (UPF0700 family)
MRARAVWTTFTADARFGALPGLMLLLTAVTGLVDAVSILRLGRVFVANMTGNVVFVGFGLAGAPGFALAASLVALAGFLVGAAAGGWFGGRFGEDRVVLLRVGSATQVVFVAAATVVVSLSGLSSSGIRDLVAGLLAASMGIQNSVARRLAVPDMTTTVLTMTLTGIASDLSSGRGGPALTRRIGSVAIMLGAAVGGAALVLHGETTLTLGLASALVALVVGGSTVGAGRLRAAPARAE